MVLRGHAVGDDVFACVDHLVERVLQIVERVGVPVDRDGERPVGVLNGGNVFRRASENEESVSIQRLS